MDKLSVTASLKKDVVERVREFQDKKGIKLFAEAFEAYIDDLEGRVSGRVTVKS